MLTRNLEYLVALARERHFGRAAAACQVTQPTLSAGIMHLEEELGILIVQRGQRFEGLTAEGERVLAWSHRILADMESLEQDASAMRDRLVGRLRLGVVPTALPIVALLTTPFEQRYPEVAVTILSLTSIDIQRGLDDFSLDAGLTYLDNEPLANVRSVGLYQERYLVFTPPDGPLGDRDTTTWREAAALPLCLLTPDMQNRRIVDANFAAAGATVRPAVVTNSVLTLCAHVGSGRWSTVLPEAFIPLAGREPSTRVLRLEGGIAPTIGLVVPDREPLTPSARALVETAEGAPVREAFRRLLGDAAVMGDGR